jgi:adenylate cyclase
MTITDRQQRQGEPPPKPHMLRRAWTALRSALRGIANHGIGKYPPEIQQRLKIVNVVSALVVITTCIYAVQLASSGNPDMMPAVFINLGVAIIVSFVPMMHRYNAIAGGLLLVTAEFIALIGFTAFFGRMGGAPLQYVIAAAATFVIFERRRVRMVFAIVGLALILHLTAWLSFPVGVMQFRADEATLTSLYIQGAITTFGLIAACVWYAFSLFERAKAETETVLRNVLPDSIVERLKAAPEEPIADGFREASVMFADITGFVSMTRALGPEKTVALLNRLVSAFDELAEMHGVEKIKTIGDAYMVASGVPVPRADHASALARMGLDIVAATRRISAEEGVAINVRVGMASGPLTAGIIGRNKFSYDVWGDPVNLASRLEQSSKTGAITVCPSCHAALKDTFVLEEREELEIKGVGRQMCWYLVSQR